jgi:hypothetical protein
MRWVVIVVVLGACGSKAPAPAEPAREIDNVVEPPSEPPPAAPTRWGWETDDREWLMTILGELQKIGDRDGRSDLVAFAYAVEVLARDADREDLSRDEVVFAYALLEEPVVGQLDQPLRDRLDAVREIMLRRKRMGKRAFDDDPDW